MDPTLEQASAFLDQAILSYSGGQIEAACEQMAAAAAVLREIQPAAPQPEPEFAAIATIDLELAAVTGCAIPAAVPSALPVTAIQPVKVEPAPEPSIAVAA